MVEVGEVWSERQSFVGRLGGWEVNELDEHHKNQQLEHPFQQLLGGRQADLGEVCEPQPEERLEFEPVNWAFDGEGVGDDRSRAGIRDPW